MIKPHNKRVSGPSRRSVLLLVVSLTAAGIGGCGRRTVSRIDKVANGPLRSVLVYAGADATAEQMSEYIRVLGNDNGFRVTVTQSGGLFTPGYLSRYQVLVVNNADHFGSTLTDEQKAALIAWYDAGGGIVALHAAAQHDGSWDWWADLIGCNYVSNSDKMTATLKVDPAAMKHPALIGTGVKLTGDTFSMEHTWPNFDRAVTGQDGVQVLVRADESSYEPVNAYHLKRDGKPMGDDHPISWVVTRGNGRLFYTALGYNVDTLDGVFASRHILAGLRWAARAENE
ncbi:MAG: hypothetical protein GC159_19670 [Phycisphaera sp.]|nr:hypothetical protein [Phycisphaera sp.]